MNKKYCITILLLALLCSCQGQVSFASALLEDLYDRLPANLRETITEMSRTSQSQHFESSIDWKDQEIVFVYRNGVLSTLGLDITGLLSLNRYDSMVISFLERTFLRLSLEKTIPDVLATAQALQINMIFRENNLLFSPIYNFTQLLDSIKQSSKFVLVQNDDRFLVEWKKENHSLLKLSFPNNFQLLTGKNKKELDEELLKELKQWHSGKSSVASAEVPSVSHDTLPIVVSPGSTYLGNLSSEIYFKKKEGDSLLVFEQALLPYSVSNLFLRKELAGNRILNLSQKLYGDRSIPFRMTLHNFLDYFDEHGYRGFVGYESNEQDLITGTVVFKHTYFNYVHMLHFKTNSSEVFANTGTISADLFANIPMHNISDLFEEYRPNKQAKTFEIKIEKP